MTKILFFIAEDWAFLTHRVPLARACLAAGWEVVLAAHVTDKQDAVRALGIALEPLPLERGGMNPLRDLAAILAMRRALRRHRPDIVHAVAMKPVLYGALAARLAGQRNFVAALAGMGYLFLARSAKARLLRGVLVRALAILLDRADARVIVQNDDDRALVLGRGIAPAARIALIRGSGVDLAAFPAMAEPPAPPVVFALVARMLADKGVREAVEAARILRAHGANIVLRLVGAPDPANPASLGADQLRGWAAEGLVDWQGPRADIAEMWRTAHVAVLPSYREGMPKALLEAAACARPIVTTDVPGCRDTIEPGVEGLLVPARDAVALADAMERLARDGELRRRMGLAARARAEARFGDGEIAEAHMLLYRALLGESPPASSSR